MDEYEREVSIQNTREIYNLSVVQVCQLFMNSIDESDIALSNLKWNTFESKVDVTFLIWLKRLSGQYP